MGILTWRSRLKDVGDSTVQQHFLIEQVNTGTKFVWAQLHDNIPTLKIGLHGSMRQLRYSLTVRYKLGSMPSWWLDSSMIIAFKMYVHKPHYHKCDIIHGRLAALYYKLYLPWSMGGVFSEFLDRNGAFLRFGAEADK
jgi:hypothetical protein